MRARRGAAIGWLVVAAFATACVVAVVTTPSGDLRPGDRPDPEASTAFVEAWERSLTATFRRSGTYERRSEVTGSAISSEDVLAQRPPRRLHRQLGGVEGRDDDRVLSCPAGPDQVVGECHLSPPGETTYEQSVASDMAGVRSLVLGVDPVYGVQEVGKGCFALAQLRAEPRAPWGVAARFCFDRATGAPTDNRVEFAGGIVDTVTVAELLGEVTDADLEP